MGLSKKHEDQDSTECLHLQGKMRKTIIPVLARNSKDPGKNSRLEVSVSSVDPLAVINEISYGGMTTRWS